MSFIKRITSARPTIETAILVAVALLALTAGVLSVRDARAAYLRAIGVESVADAEALPRGAARDRLLDRAQGRLHDALEVYPGDAALWMAMARVRYLQATGAEVTEVSPPLLNAAIEAARQAEALEPMNYEAPALTAQALSMLPGGNRSEAAEALARSYVRRVPDPAGSNARIATAATLWPSLNGATRQAALAEACVLSRQSGQGAEGVRTAIAASPDFTAQFAAITTQAGCAPATSIQSPNN